jgi:FlaA1/EpsC-like NDP-sugar epimerase
VITVISFFVLYFSSLYNKMWQYASMSELYSIFKAAGRDIVSGLVDLVETYQPRRDNVKKIDFKQEQKSS